MVRSSIDHRLVTGSVPSEDRSWGRTHVARDTDGVNRQLPELAPLWDSHIPAQPVWDEDESASNDIPVTANCLMAIIHSEVEWLVAPDKAAPAGDRGQPTLELQLPVTSATGCVRQGGINALNNAGYITSCHIGMVMGIHVG